MSPRRDARLRAMEDPPKIGASMRFEEMLETETAVVMSATKMTLAIQERLPEERATGPKKMALTVMKRAPTWTPMLT